jgi:hypothetical protein
VDSVTKFREGLLSWCFNMSRSGAPSNGSRGPALGSPRFGTGALSFAEHRMLPTTIA